MPKGGFSAAALLAGAPLRLGVVTGSTNPDPRAFDSAASKRSGALKARAIFSPPRSSPRSSRFEDRRPILTGSRRVSKIARIVLASRMIP